jgi:preprotein translocase subunit SecY
MSMPVRGSLPLMVNMAGMIPIIFAQSILTFPSIIASFFTGISNQGIANFAMKMQELFGGTGNFYWVMYFLSVVLFTFFYTDVLFAQQNYGENLKKVGAQIPGVARGAPTQRYLTRVLRHYLPGCVLSGPGGNPALVDWSDHPFGQSTGLMLVELVRLIDRCRCCTRYVLQHRRNSRCTDTMTPSWFVSRRDQ